MIAESRITRMTLIGSPSRNSFPDRFGGASSCEPRGLCRKQSFQWRDALPRVQDKQKLVPPEMRGDTPATTVNRLALHKLSDEIF
jgi:hypothetical protein